MIEDTNLRPYLIEVNHLPSWGTDSSLDDAIKSKVITQALRAINVKASDRRKFAHAAKRQSQLRLGKQTASTSETDDDDGSNRNADAVDEHISLAKRAQPNLFESNIAERKIRAIYAKKAPEKLQQVPALLKRFRGYEEWLVMKVQSKYEKSDSSSEESSCEESDCSSREQEHQMCLEEERILEDYDRIYPPKGHGIISPSRFKEMEEYISEVDHQQQRRLLCPLQQIRNNGDADVDNKAMVNAQPHSSRADGWIGGNIHIRKNSEQPKIIAPPTQKQKECADRLSQGFSTGNTATSKTTLQQRKNRILNHDLVYDEINPFFHLTDRVSQARELSKEARQRAEMKLSRRLVAGIPLRVQMVDLGLSSEHSCLRLGTEDKFYTKKKYHTH
jgi:hypothetical protein